MRQGTHKFSDPLGGIEEMLSTLCGEQSHRSDIPHQDIEIQGTADLHVLGENNSIIDDILGADGVPTTPEKSTSPKDRRQRREKTAFQQKRPAPSERLPAGKRIRKTRRGEGKQQGAQQNNFGTLVTGHDDEDGQQDHDFLDTSSDDRENMKFLDQMKRLAEDQLNVHKRKNDAMNVNTINAMKRHTDQCVQTMKQIAGKVSNDIINRASEIEEALPSKLAEKTASAMNAVNSERYRLSDFLSQTKDFEDQVNKLVLQVQKQRIENKEKLYADEQKVYENAETACGSGQRLTSVLQKVDEMIGVDQFKEG